MGRSMRSLVSVLGLCLWALCFSSSAQGALDQTAAIETILQKIESRHYRWVAIRADVVLFFAASETSSAMCGGELLYQRLDERMFLSCVDPQKNLVFVFRTLDNRFDLYLPSQNTVYHGSIFDMEDSPDIESHLKPRDLYRALKPLAFDPKRTEIEKDDPVHATLNVYNERQGERSLARRLYLSPEGDVLGEVYYGADGLPAAQIQRYDFQEIRSGSGLYRSIIFPKKITVVSPATQKGSAIFFSRVKAMDSVDVLDFILRVPVGTKEVFLDEKIPPVTLSRFQKNGPMKQKTGENKKKTDLEGEKEASGINNDADFAPENLPDENPPIVSNEPAADVVPEPEGPVVQYPKPPESSEDLIPDEALQENS